MNKSVFMDYMDSMASPIHIDSHSRIIPKLLISYLSAANYSYSNRLLHFPRLLFLIPRWFPLILNC